MDYKDLKTTHNFLNGVFTQVIKTMVRNGIEKSKAIDYIQDIAENHRQEKIFEAEKC